MSEVSHLVHDVPGPIVPAERQNGLPKVAADDAVDVLNDDVLIDVPPVRLSGTVHVRLVPTGRSTPIPADDPWAM